MKMFKIQQKRIYMLHAEIIFQNSLDNVLVIVI